MVVKESLFLQALKLYEGLEAAAVPEEVDEAKFAVFRGSLVKVFDDLKFSRSTYSRIVGFLVDNGCISYLQRGGRSIDSVIVLHKRPNPEGMDLQPLTGAGRYDRLDSKVKVIEERLGGLDITKAFADVERRLRKLEGRR